MRSPTVSTPTFRRQQALRVDSEEITFFNTAPGRVKIVIRVHNDGLRTSLPTQMVVQAAPLGAFVRWQPLATAAVPAIEPGGFADVVLHARHEQGSGEEAAYSDRGFDPLAAEEAELFYDDLDDPLPTETQLPPNEPTDRFTLLGTEDDGRFGLWGRTWSGRMQTDSAGILAYYQAVLAGDLDTVQGPALLPTDDGRSVHWAGNLNVFIDKKPVERHLARSLRIYPGMLNQALFFVGDGPDAYQFEIECDKDWKVGLQLGWADPSEAFTSANEISLNRWIHLEDQVSLTLSIEAPPDCTEGAVIVHVTQRSSGKSTKVEFTFDPNAQGPGCYTA